MWRWNCGSPRMDFLEYQLENVFVWGKCLFVIVSRTGGRLLSSTNDDDESTSSEPRIAGEPVGDAIETCARRLAKLPEISGVSRGISFGIDVKPSSRTHLGVYFSTAARFRCWKSIYQTCPVFIRRKDGKTPSSTLAAPMWCGTPWGLATTCFCCRSELKLFPYSKGDLNPEAVAAGQQLRKLCRESWQKQTGSAGTLHELSFSAWRRRRFTRKFDRVLLDHAGSGNLNTILKQMGTRLESLARRGFLGFD